MKIKNTLFTSITLTLLLSCISGYRIAKTEHINDNLAKDDSDVGLRVPELIIKYGYPVETHTVETEDGYLLTMHRIPHGKNDMKSAERKEKKVVFLQHGLLCSSADWVLMGPEKGLAYLLADKGYDVWMGNARGNTYSRHHVKYNPDTEKEKFWNFSWHEIGVYDLPAMIDFITEKTKVKKVFYIAHSQGTTAFFVMASERPEYNEKIRLMVALAPVAFMEHIPNLAFQIIAKFHPIIGWVINMLGQYEFLPSTTFMQLIGQALCNNHSTIKELCSNILFLIAGYDEEQLDKAMIPVILSNTPAGASTKQLIHYAQLHTSKEFQQFDYGSKNEVIYGPGFKHPPIYNLNKISAPVAMYYGQNDLLTAEQDIMKLHEKLPHSVLTYKVKYPRFSHLDFLWSIDIIKNLYNNVYDILSRY